MKILTLLIALVAIVLSLISIVLVNINRGQAKATTTTYILKGSIDLTNDCDGKLDSLPNKVRVHSRLKGTKGTAGGKDVVALKPADPNDPNNPRKIGAYEIRVYWDSKQMGDPKVWSVPDVKRHKSEKFAPKEPICKPIKCPDVLDDCEDPAQKANIGCNEDGETTQHNIVIVCVCQ